MLSILDVINSTKLLTNFGVTCGGNCWRKSAVSYNGSTYSRCFMIKVVQILVQGIAIQLDCDDVFRGRISNAEGLLKALKYACAILVWILEHNISDNF